MSKELEVITSVEDVPQSSIKEFENSCIQSRDYAEKNDSEDIHEESIVRILNECKGSYTVFPFSFLQERVGKRLFHASRSWYSFTTSNPGQLGFMGSRSQCPTIKAFGKRWCKLASNWESAFFWAGVRVSSGNCPLASSPPTQQMPMECPLWKRQ